jgi:hypothetical protein
VVLRSMQASQPAIEKIGWGRAPLPPQSISTTGRRNWQFDRISTDDHAQFNTTGVSAIFKTPQSVRRPGQDRDRPQAGPPA